MELKLQRLAHGMEIKDSMPYPWRTDFQSESKKSGDEFEDIVYKDLVSRGFSYIDRNYSFIGLGCEVDFRAHSDTRFEYVEAKGGNAGEGKRPGAQRTDNVKKAIANGALIKTSNTLYYVVYFSAKPEPGSYSDQMINTALKYKIIDEVRYI
jgi:hypothetical protein